MIERVNVLRTKNGLSPVDDSEVTLLESRAQGHIDYTHKWALYCAELVTTPVIAAADRS